MTANAERIKRLLGSGLSNDVVANAVGCTPSYVTQLMSDEKFAEEVINLRSASLVAATARDRSWDSVEDKLLEKLDEQVDAYGFAKPMDLLRAISVVNQAKRRGNPVQQSLTTHNTVVTLVLPTQVIHSFTKSRTGEVVEVDGQTLVPMTAATLMSKLAAKNPESERYEQVRRYLPSASTPEEG